MSDSLISRIKSSLRSQFYHVNDSWLKECVEYYTSEHADTNPSAVQAFVTSQWLLSDLREINNDNGYLPTNINQREKIVLPGKYIIQVDKMCDISQSKYSQLQKIRNVSDINVKATEIVAPAWEPKGKRMIQLYLTDGIQDFTAIEYKPIEALKDTLLPGFKVMIIGPVTCRKGVLMLKEENYKEIGGEVDSLLKVNALENVLARALELEENENPYADNNEESNPVGTDNEFPEDEFDINFDEITQIERLSMENEESPVHLAPSTNVSNSRTDIRVNTAARNSREIDQRAENFGKKIATDYYVPQKESGNNFERKSQEVTTIVDFDEPCDDMLSSIGDNNPNLILAEKTRAGNNSEILSRSQLKPMTSRPNSYLLKNNGISTSSDQGIQEVRKNVTNVSKNYTNVPSTSSSLAAEFPEDEDFDFGDFEVPLDEHTLRENNTRDAASGPVKNGSIILPKPSEEVKKKLDSPKMPALAKSKGNSERKSPTISLGKRSADNLSPLGCSSKILCLQNTPQTIKKNRKITEFAKKITPKEDMPPKICDFIRDAIKETVQGSVIYKTVRGRVTQVGRLLKKDKNWDLTATITDGTASLEITFSSQVLEELIGFTVSEFAEKKKLRKTNPEMEEYLRSGFRNAEFRVQRMDALLELEFPGNNELPKVVNTTQLTEKQKELIEKRIKMMSA